MKLRLLAVLSLCLLAAFGCATDKNISPITRYDTELHAAVKKSWHEAVQNVDQTKLKKGRIVVRFLLRSNGQISDVQIIENNLGPAEAIIVARAVMNQDNYKPWPEDMVQMVGAHSRFLTFQFIYK